MASKFAFIHLLFKKFDEIIGNITFQNEKATNNLQMGEYAKSLKNLTWVLFSLIRKLD